MRPMAWVALLLGTVVVLNFGPMNAAEPARLRHLGSVYVDEKGTGLHLPEGVACAATGGFVVGDTGNDRIVQFAWNDKTPGGGREIRLPELSAPTRLQLSPAGGIVALDGRRRRLVRLGADGTFGSIVSFAGVPPPATVVPRSFRLDAQGHLYVLDAFSARVLVMGADGAFQKAVPLPADAGQASDVDVDLTGTILVLDATRRQVLAAAKDATTFAPLGTSIPRSLTSMPVSLTGSKGTLLVAESETSSLVAFGRDGTFLARPVTAGWAEGALNHPSQICINDQDEVFVADRENSRVQVFALVR